MIWTDVFNVTAAITVCLEKNYSVNVCLFWLYLLLSRGSVRLVTSSELARRHIIFCLLSIIEIQLNTYDSNS